jgi:hypothetical protein
MACSLFVLAAPRAGAIIISGTDPNAAQWSAASLTGLAFFSQSEGSCSGSLFEPTLTYIITAAHCVNDLQASINSGSAYVQLGTAGSGGSSSIASFTVDPNYCTTNCPGGFSYQNDIAILQLVTPAPAGTQYYPIYGGDSVGSLFALAGYGDAGTGDTGDNGSYPYYDKIPRMGNNVYDFSYGTQYFYDFQNSSGQYNAFKDAGYPYSLFVPNEATIGPGDSGGPSLVCVASNGSILNSESCTNGTLEIAGIHDVVGCFQDSNGNCLYSESSTFNDGYGSYAADTNASLYTGFISSVVDAPEPGTFGALGIGLAALVLWRRRV